MVDPTRYCHWLKQEGPSGHIVLSSRLRLARNLERIPFPPMATQQALERVAAQAEEAVDGHERLRHLVRFHLSALPLLDRQVLVETHLISPQYAQGGAGHLFLVEEDGPTSIMVNEEDHFRLQCILPGLDLARGWERIAAVDDDLEAHLDFAYHDQWGFLTTCPTNVGTGLRASTLVHLPALAFTNLLQKLFHAVGQLGIAVRGLYGEGTESQGHFFQISNQSTLGPSEEEILERVGSVTDQVIAQELQAREALRQSHLSQITDRIWRAYGLLLTARMVTSEEAMEHLSMVRLGAAMAILPPLPLPALNELMVTLKPACIQRATGREMDPGERDVTRAAIIRRTLRSPFRDP